MKNIYIIPGYYESEFDFSYTKVFLKSKGFNVTIVPIIWKYKKVSDWVKQVNTYFSSNNISESIIIGFSAGALVLSLVDIDQSKTNHIILCSMPYTLGKLITKEVEKDISFLGVKRILELKKVDVYPQLKKIKFAKFDVVCGELESPALRKHMKKIHTIVKRSKFSLLPRAVHDLNSNHYVEGLYNLVLKHI